MHIQVGEIKFWITTRKIIQIYIIHNDVMFLALFTNTCREFEKLSFMLLDNMYFPLQVQIGWYMLAVREQRREGRRCAIVGNIHAGAQPNVLRPIFRQPEGKQEKIRVQKQIKLSFISFDNDSFLLEEIFPFS